MKASIKFHRKYKWISEVAIHYWNSKFLGHTHSDDLVKVFNGLNELDLTKLTQILMDGPISNLKFFSEIKKLRIEDEPTSLIDTGCYNLHVHFCGTSWVEDKMVTEKLIKLWPNMIKVFDFWNILCKPKQPCSKSYENTKKGIEDPLTMAKLHFLSFVARLLQPFLKVFQGDGLMIPFLCNNIRSIYISLLELIVKAKALENVESYDLLQVVNSDDNLLQTKRIHVGFAAKSEIKRLLQTKQVGF